MDAGHLLANRMHDHQRNLQSKRGTLVDAAAGDVDCSAVHLNQLTGNGKAQTESAALAGDPGVRLAESLEHMR